MRRIEMPLAQGINFERRLFHGLFGSDDQKEGMAAFVEKRPGIGREDNCSREPRQEALRQVLTRLRRGRGVTWHA